jgi:cyclase
MGTVRIIGRLDIKEDRLIKGIHLEGWRFVGNPNEYARRYYEGGIDELLYVDSVASLYGREKLKNIVEETTKNVFIPLTVEGGVRSLDDAYDLLRAGADKVAVCTGAVRNPKIISDIASCFGQQCMVISIQAKKTEDNKWEAYVDCSREPTGLDVVEWAKKAVSLGAGEVLLTSIDREGTGKGFDVALVRAVAQSVPVRVIASGGLGAREHFVQVVNDGHASGVAVAAALHYDRITIEDLRSYALENGVAVRRLDRPR